MKTVGWELLLLSLGWGAAEWRRGAPRTQRTKKVWGEMRWRKNSPFYKVPKFNFKTSLKITFYVISIESPFVEKHFQFTVVPMNPLSNYQSVFFLLKMICNLHSKVKRCVHNVHTSSFKYFSKISNIIKSNSAVLENLIENIYFLLFPGSE